MAVAAGLSDGAVCGVLSVQAAADCRTAGGGWGCVHDWSVGAHSLLNTSINYTCLAQASHWQFTYGCRWQTLVGSCFSGRHLRSGCWCAPCTS